MTLIRRLEKHKGGLVRLAPPVHGFEYPNKDKRVAVLLDVISYDTNNRCPSAAGVYTSRYDSLTPNAESVVAIVCLITPVVFVSSYGLGMYYDEYTFFFMVARYISGCALAAAVLIKMVGKPSLADTDLAITLCLFDNKLVWISVSSQDIEIIHT